MTEPSGEAFQTNESDDVETRSFELSSQLLGLVKVGRREPMGPIVRISMLALSQVSFDDPSELRVEEIAACEPIKE